LCVKEYLKNKNPYPDIVQSRSLVSTSKYVLTIKLGLLLSLLLIIDVHRATHYTDAKGRMIGYLTLILFQDARTRKVKENTSDKRNNRSFIKRSVWQNIENYLKGPRFVLCRRVYETRAADVKLAVEQ